jgi:hypothetical protein
MKTYGGVSVWIHVFLNSVLDGGEWSGSRPGRFSPEEAPGTNWIGGCVGPRTGLHDLERRKNFPLFGRPTRRQSRYRLRYTGSLILSNNHL